MRAKPLSRGQWLALLAVLLAGVVLRLEVFSEPETRLRLERPVVDAAWHDWWARGLAFGTWAPPAGQPDPEIASHAYFKPPGYPGFLAAIYMVAGDRPMAVRLVQAGLGLVTALLAFVVVWRRFGFRAGLTTLLLLTGNPLLILYEGELLEPVLSGFLAALLVFVAEIACERQSPWWALGGGIITGAAAVVRPNVLLCIPVLAWWGGRNAAGVGRERAVAGIACFTVGVALLVGPVMMRNLLVEGEPVLISANGGLNLLLGNHDGSDGASPVGPGFQRWSSFEYAARIRRFWPAESPGFAEASRRFGRQAIAWAWENPGEFIRLSGRKLFLLLGPQEVENAGNRVEKFELSRSLILSWLPFGFPVFLVFALAGGLLGKGERTVSLVAGLAALWLLSFVPFFAAARFRAPVIPLLAILAGFAIDRLFRLLEARNGADHGRMVLALMGGVILAVPNWTGFAPGFAEGWFQRGIDLTLAGRIEEARDAYRSVLTLAPEHAWTHNNYGSLLLQAGDEEGALRHFRLGAKDRENCPEGLYNLGVLSGRRGAWDEAFGALSEFVRRVPERAEGWYNFGLAATGMERLETAEDAYRRALKIDPRDTAARNNLAVVLTLQKRFSEAWTEVINCREQGFEPDPGLVETIRSNVK